MDKIRFLRYRTEFGYDYRTDNSNMFLASLAHFLLIELACFSCTSWIDSIDKLQDDSGISGNMIDIEKKKNKLYLSYLYDDIENPFEALEILQEELFKVMLQWEKLMKRKPEEIILVRDNGKFELIERSSKNAVNKVAES